MILLISAVQDTRYDRTVRIYTTLDYLRTL